MGVISTVTKKKAEYRTAWFLQKLSDIDKQMYECIINAMRDTRSFRNKQLLAKYVAYSYLSVGRRIEGFLKPPTITKFTAKGMNLIKVNKINAKHFTRNNKRVEITQIFYPLNKYEQALWEFVMDGKEIATIDFMPLICNDPMLTKGMSIKERENYIIYKNTKGKEVNRLANLTTSIKNKFKADITNGEIKSHEGIRPHILKHIRVYDLKKKGVGDVQVLKLAGWDDADMLYQHYIDLKQMLSAEEQIDFYANTFRKQGQG